MQIFAALVLTLLRTALCCGHGLILCPPGTNSSGVCVPLQRWCASLLYLNPFAAPEERVGDLLSRLTLPEKVNLLQSGPINISSVPRLQVPRTTFAECLHGYCSGTPSSLFPQSISLAATFNPSLVTRVAAAIGMEARAWRNRWEAAGDYYNATNPPPSLSCFAPQINIVRDPRWGRAQETYGECPALTQAMAKAYVRGLQNGDGSMDGAGYHLAQANTKHFIGYQGASTRGLYSPTEVYLSTRDMIDTFEPGWRGALEANSAGVMCAYSTLCDDDTNTTCFQRYGLSHGIPMCAHPEMLNGWLRASGGEGAAPGWNGTVVGDCGAIKFLETDHRWAVNQSDAAAKALHAGTDLDCTIEPGTGFAALLNATREGLTTPHAIDAALGRFLTNQLKLGLYDPPEMNPWRAIPMGLVNGPAHRGLAAQAARESLVLLANAGGVLPLRAGAFTAPGSLLVTGPNAQLIASGNYNAQTDVNVTAWMGLARALPPGAALLAPGCQCVACPSTSLFPAALAAAGGAGAIVAVMGLDASQEYEDSTRASLALPGVQEELLLALCAAAAPRGTPVVLVLMGGSAVAPSPAVLGAVSAVVWAGYAGEEAGTALAGAIFGLYSPGGRMPFTTYSNASDLPPYYNMSLQGAPFGRTYRYFTGPPVTFRFGAGLSYTRFSYTPLALGVPVAASQSAPPAAAPLLPCQALNVTLTVQNSGAWDGDEVVQCYVRLVGVGGGATPASAAPQVVLPRLSLAAFSRVSLPAASPPMAVSFSLGPRSLAIVNATALGWQQVPCTVQVFVGSQQPTDEDWDSAQALSVPLSGPPTLVSTCPSQ